MTLGVNRRSLLTGLISAAGVVGASLSRAFAATQFNITARAGEELGCHSYYRIDANGKEWPMTVRFTARPRHGTVTTKTALRTVRTPVGDRVVHAVRVFYTAKVGYAGGDSFAYRRITADPTDTTSGEEFIVAVTVR